MYRIVVSFISFLLIFYFYIIYSNRSIDIELPIFLKTDAIVMQHQTEIDINFESKYIPDSFQIANFKNDYSALWSHLNEMYCSNNVTIGKEYYTELWFKQHASNYQNTTESIGLKREDLKHHLYIQNWSTDNLVCTLIDSNIEMMYHYPDSSISITHATVCLVLLYQGDHWRIDAMRVIDEPLIFSNRKIN